ERAWHKIDLATGDRKDEFTDERIFSRARGRYISRASTGNARLKLVPDSIDVASTEPACSSAMRRADCISASVPVAVLAIGHAASNVRSTQLSGTDSDSCDTANVTRPSFTESLSAVGPPFSPINPTVAMTRPASALARSS